VLLRRLSVVCVLPAFALFGAACASAGTGTGEADAPAAGAQTGMAVSIDNNVAGADSHIVFILPEAGGVRQQIGRIDPAEQRTFTFQGAPGNYQIVLQSASGTRTSNRFRLAAGQLGTWRLDRSDVVVSNR